MNNEAITQICEPEVLETTARLLGTSRDRLDKCDDYVGCANLIHHYENERPPRVLCLPYRPG